MAKRTKRVNGDGSVYKRGAGYEAAITVDGSRRTARAKTKTEAEAALRRLRAQRDTGALPRKQDTTTAEYMAYWLKVQEPRLRYSTSRRYAELLSRAVAAFGGVPLTRLAGPPQLMGTRAS